MKKNILLTLALIPLLTYASGVPEFTPKDNMNFEDLDTIDNRPQAKQPLNKASNSKSVSVNEKQLLANPKLLERAMNSVLIAKDPSKIKLVLKIYKKLPNADKALINYGKALIKHSEGKFTKAIALYNKVLAEKPDWLLVRLDLAVVLYANRQNSESKNQLQRIRSEKNLPKDVKQLIEKQLGAINKRDEWNFDGTFYYQQDKNINGAPKETVIKTGNGGKLILPEAIAAHGFHLDLGVSKKNSFNNHLYTKFNLSASADYYWDAKDYNDYNFRLGFGGGYQTNRFTFEAQPFVKKRIFGNKSFSETAGISTRASYWTSNKLELSTNFEYSYDKHKEREHLDGNRYLAGVSGLYIVNARQYWQIGTNFYKNEADDKSDTYDRPGF